MWLGGGDSEIENVNRWSDGRPVSTPVLFTACEDDNCHDAWVADYLRIGPHGMEEPPEPADEYNAFLCQYTPGPRKLHLEKGFNIVINIASPVVKFLDQWLAV